MSSLHTLLLRQLRKWFPAGAPDGSAAFIEAVNSAYHQFDDDRRMLERSLDLSSRELMQANQELRRNLSLLQSTLESTADGILVVDAKGTIVSFNQRFAQMWQIPHDVLESRDDDRAIAHVLGQLLDPEQFVDKVRELYSAPAAESFDVLDFKDGGVFERYSIPQLLDGRAVGRVWSFRDVTARAKAEARLVHDAIHDALTGLPNRTLFLDRLQQAVRHSKRHLEHRFAVLFVDVDRFKVVNDSLGHLVGDELLIAIAERIRKTVRPADTVGRHGGDEFTVLLEDVEKPEDAIVAAERIESVIAAPFRVQGNEIFSTVSIGIAVSAPHYTRAEELLRDADIAMYRAKSAGRATHQLFQPGMYASATVRMQLESDLRRALEREEMVLHYQPVVSLADARILGVEALLRWNHPQRGLVLPDQFISISEETGLIVPIGRWALAEACARVRSWQRAFERDDLTVSVNLSSLQLVQPSLADDVERVLRDTNLAPRTLVLEITESVLVGSIQGAVETIERMRALGVQVHIDDFGTGYSSLSYLNHLPVDALKIDRSFIAHIATGEENVDIIRTIATLAGNLRLGVIAEGIETNVQRERLQALGVTAGQGTYFSMPADESAVRTMLGSGRFPGHTTTPRARPSAAV